MEPARRAVVLALAIAAGRPSTRPPRAGQPGPSLPQPIVQSVFPGGVSAGGTVDVTVRGTDLEGATASGSTTRGSRAFHLKGHDVPGRLRTGDAGRPPRRPRRRAPTA